MKFLLNSKLVNEAGVSADLTLLRYLREKQQLVGTKEGCASGDCGACTVLIGEVDENSDDLEVVYRTVNSCITPVAAANGRRIVTVEALAQKDRLHPAQRAMVDCDGSQCGFCTPGFVMSLVGLYQSELNSKADELSRHSVCDAISGNLCRCTGYRPIVEAGLQMGTALDDEWSLNDSDVVKALGQITEQTPSENYITPTSLDSLDTAILRHPDAPLIAGGTDLVLKITQNYERIPVLIDITRVPELSNISVSESTIEIGAAVTFAQLEKTLAQNQPQFGELLKRIASRQIRNRGTVGGNIANASPIADLPPFFLSLDAVVHLRDKQSQTRQLPLHGFYQSYKTTAIKAGEYITGVSFDASCLSDFYRVYKVSKRVEDDISSVIAAIRFRHDAGRFTDVRIAFGGMAATPLRVETVEQVLSGQDTHDEAILVRAMEVLTKSLSPMSDVRASAQYRSAIAANLLRKAWLEFNGEVLPTVVNLMEPDDA